MISVTEAKKIIISHSEPLGPCRVPLSKALHRVLAQDIQAPVDLPLYDNSAMDGFAIQSQDVKPARPDQGVRLRVVGVIRAGDHPTRILKNGEAFRIMTGAPIPPGCDAVVAKERVQDGDEVVEIQEPVAAGKNIRKAGEELARGCMVLSKGQVLTSRDVGLLAGLGFGEVPVHRPPRVALLVTGSELIAPGETRSPGTLYDSNSAMLGAALQELHLEACRQRRVPDDEGEIRRGLEEAMEVCDVVLVAGGVSVGDYDFTKPVLERLGMETLFWKVAQKPGKPLLFGKRGRTLVFGLPGNPVSVWLCFHEYVRSALLALQGLGEFKPSAASVPLEGELAVVQGKTVFYRGKSFRENGEVKVKPLKGQGSHMLWSLAQADCFIEVSETEVEIHPL